VLGEVVADQCVEQFDVSAKVRVRQNDQLPVACCGCVPAGAGQQGTVTGHDGCGDQQRCRNRVSGEVENLCGRVGVLADQAAKKGSIGVRHNCTVHPGADGALTTAHPAPGVP
jgi:hypothetical protein